MRAFKKNKRIFYISILWVRVIVVWEGKDRAGVYYINTGESSGEIFFITDLSVYKQIDESKIKKLMGANFDKIPTEYPYESVS